MSEPIEMSKQDIIDRDRTNDVSGSIQFGRLVIQWQYGNNERPRHAFLNLDLAKKFKKLIDQYIEIEQSNASARKTDIHPLAADNVQKLSA